MTSVNPGAVGEGTLKVLSVRAPWWWWIFHGGKDIENRDWATDYRGPCAIHASKWWSGVGFAEDWECARRIEQATGKPMVGSGLWSPDKIRATGGHVVGIVDIVDCVRESKSPWFFGKFGFALANARPIEPIQFKARLGLFNAPPEILAAQRSCTATPTPEER